MSEGVINNTVLDYSLVKYFKVPYSNTVKFYTGYLFPNNKSIVQATWNFGDGTTVTTSFSSNEQRFNDIVTAVRPQADFFPRWDSGVDNCTGILIPKFEVDHTFNNGSYSVNVSLLDVNGNSYIGTPINIDINTEYQNRTIPQNWGYISQTYRPSTDINYLAKNGVPGITTEVSSVSSIPIDVNFNITNILNRLDIDYIEWNFGDGTFEVKSILGAIIIPEITKNSYSYKLIPTKLVYEPQVTIYFSNKTKYKIQIPSIPLIDVSNISISINSSNNTTVTNTPTFNITPVLSYNLPVETQFTHIISKNLKYIIWNYSDGEYDVIPVSYTPSLSNILQTYDIFHKYTSVNYYNYLPKCLLIYQDDNGEYYSERYRSIKQLNYQLGIIQDSGTGTGSYITSTTNFQKYDNISSLIEYPETNTGFATVHLRLSLSLPIQILYFEKIVWDINGDTIIQDKNTTEKFGKLTLKNVTTSIDTNSPLNVSATLYGIPALYASIPGNNLLTEFGTYSRQIYVLDKDLQDAINEESIFTLENPVITNPSIITTEEGVEIITPIIDTEVQVVEQEEQVYIGSNIVFDTLFTATNPIGNFLNRQYPTVASKPSNNLVSKRVIGFFKPSKTTPVIIDPGKFTFSINMESIEYDKPFYFPDPYKYGSNTSILNFFTLDQSFKKNARYGKARNEPNQPADSVSYYGYNSNNPNNFNSIYDSGYIHDSKNDIYGNVYGLLKDNNNFRQNIEEDELTKILTLQLNGYKFYDDIFGENIAFNYSLTGILGTETFRSGISSFTNGFSSRSEGYYTLNFGDFNRISKFKVPTEVIDVNTQYLNPINIGIRDGAFFMLNETEFLPDSISSDLSSFALSGTYYFTTLLEAGVRSATPYVRPLLAPSLSAIFTQNVRVSGNNGVVDIDCGVFETNFNINDSFFDKAAPIYIDSVNPSSTTTFLTGISSVIEELSIRDSLTGSIIVKDINGSYADLIDKLDYLQNKYPQTVFSSLTSGIKEFDLVYNTYFIKTSQYLICDKVLYENNMFNNPKTNNVIIEYNNNLYNTISNRFKVQDYVYFAVLSAYEAPSTTSAFVYPIIYKINTQTLKQTQVFPTDSISNYSNYFNISTGNVLYVEADTPRLTYNVDLDMFNLSYLLKDQNKIPYLVSVNFKDSDSVINSVNGFKFGVSNITNQFNSASSINTFTAVLTSGSYNITTYLTL